MNIIKQVKSNVSRFIPRSLRKRYGRSSRAPMPEGTRVLVLEDGDEHEAVVVSDQGATMHLKFVSDRDEADVDASQVRRAPRRRRAPSAEIAPEAYAGPEPADVA